VEDIGITKDDGKLDDKRLAMGQERKLPEEKPRG
jgi:hypothetical protein